MSSERSRITIMDVAREARVSVATVSYVLNQDPRQKIPEETRIRVKEAALRLGYQPSLLARSLRRGKSNIVLVVWSESVVEESIADLIERLASALEKIGFSLLWQFSFSSTQHQLVAGLAPVAIVGLIDETDMAALANLQRFRAPIITLANRDWIRLGPRVQVEYLVGRGWRSIVYAAPEKPQLQSLARDREEAVREACRQHALPEPRVITISQKREQARQQLAELLAVQSPPFAICAFNDSVALACLAALSDLDVPVPDVVGVIGHDNTRVAELSIPALTTIGLDNLDLAEQLIASVLSVCQGGPALRIGPLRLKVIMRSSA
jgi:DNA-binding LacI/PurR family transcriptional regulator